MTQKPLAVLVLSGKGGVGKTLISTNIALTMRDRGLQTGLLDADFSASNVGYFLDLKGKPMELSREEFHPIDYNGMELFSISLLMGDRGVSMTGDQYGQLLRDSIEETDWKCKYLVVDCPAGIGDEFKVLGKVFADSLLGSIIVFQPAHVLDARKVLQLHKDLEMPILGLIENMSYFKVGEERMDIFGGSVADALGQEYGVPVFGKIPLSMDIRRQVERKDPKLAGEYAVPINNAVDAIAQAKPIRPGFLTQLKEMLKGNVVRLVVELVLSINKEVDVSSMQRKYGYPGGMIVRLNIMDNDLEHNITQADYQNHIITQTDWIIQDGKLIVLDSKQGKYTVDAQIDLTPDAVKWAYLANKKMANGEVYTFRDAQRLGHMKFYGRKSMPMAAFLMRDVFTELGRNEAVIARLKPLLEAL
jgi:ATP-binding protein involved in chromosome partitioning